MPLLAFGYTGDPLLDQASEGSSPGESPIRRWSLVVACQMGVCWHRVRPGPPVR